MRWQGLLLAPLLLIAATGCNLTRQLLPTLTALPRPTATPESQWNFIQEGLEWRILRPNDEDISQLVVVRIDPDHFRFRAIYRAGDPQRPGKLARFGAFRQHNHQRQLLRSSLHGAGSGG